MTPTTTDPHKDYAERGVQTESQNPTQSPNPFARLPTIQESEPYASPTPPGLPQSPAQSEAAYNLSSDLSFESVSSDANRSMTTTTRVLKKQHLARNVPSKLKGKSVTSRISSLPEAAPKYRAGAVLERKPGGRVVSMPVSKSNDDSITSDSLDMSAHLSETLGTDEQERSRVRVLSHGTDIPYTPSPPSSPESILIIANSSNQLSRAFLRRRDGESTPPDSDDEGWITWAKSPPRPIPALHGPLSLPYARCPSGAEGTIIDEPESLTRMIWGLESDEVQSSRSRPGPLHQAQASSTPKKPNNFTPNVPPRLQKPKHEPPRKMVPPSAAIPAPQHPIAPSATGAPQPNVTHSARVQPPPPPPPVVPEFLQKHSEPIDLGHLMQSSGQRPIHPGYAMGVGMPHLQNRPGLLPHGLVCEPQHVLAPQQSFGGQGMDSPLGMFGHGAHGLPTPPISASNSLNSVLDAVKSTRSPIFLDQLVPGHFPTATPRMSALEIAQSYRAQQMQQNLLPTPPNSTSPVWTPAFSPYQGGLLSPELLAAAGLSHLANHQATGLRTQLPTDDSQHIIRLGNGTVKGNFPNSRLNQPSAPSVQLANIPSYDASLSPNVDSSRGPSLSQTVDRARLQNRADPRLSSPARSPAAPRPPPNTPHSITSPNSSKRNNSHVALSSLATPLSPGSPKDAQLRALSHGHPRSAPFSRLAQRRLSSVPEEEYISGGESGRSPSRPVADSGGRIYGSTSGGSFGTGAAGLQLFLSPSRLGRNSVPPKGLGESTATSLASQHGHEDYLSELARDGIANVKLPVASFPVAPKEAGCDLPSRGEAVAGDQGGGRRRQGNHSKEEPPSVVRNEGSRGRGGKSRPGRGRKGRNAGNTIGHGGAERIDGGMMVKS